MSTFSTHDTHLDMSSLWLLVIRSRLGNIEAGDASRAKAPYHDQPSTHSGFDWCWLREDMVRVYNGFVGAGIPVFVGTRHVARLKGHVSFQSKSKSIPYIGGFTGQANRQQLIPLFPYAQVNDFHFWYGRIFIGNSPCELHQPVTGIIYTEDNTAKLATKSTTTVPCFCICDTTDWSHLSMQFPSRHPTKSHQNYPNLDCWGWLLLANVIEDTHTNN